MIRPAIEVSWKACFSALITSSVTISPMLTASLDETVAAAGPDFDA